MEFDCFENILLRLQFCSPCGDASGQVRHIGAIARLCFLIDNKISFHIITFFQLAPDTPATALQIPVELPSIAHRTNISLPNATRYREISCRDIGFLAAHIHSALPQSFWLTRCPFRRMLRGTRQTAFVPHRAPRCIFHHRTRDWGPVHASHSYFARCRCRVLENGQFNLSNAQFEDANTFLECANHRFEQSNHWFDHANQRCDYTNSEFDRANLWFDNSNYRFELSNG